MIFQPQTCIRTDGYFTISKNVDAITHSCLNKDVIKDFWRSFALQGSALSISETDKFIFLIGNAEPLPLDGYDYSINVAPDGICVYAENEKDLIRGFMTLIDRFQAIDRDEELTIQIDCCQIKDKPKLSNRMVHFCVFPETELWELQRYIRFCGALKYTHVILEFWGMLQYDCMKELSWSHGFTKEQIRPLIREANYLGIEIIPMFNHWGHAALSRSMQGKHVVLDQNPALRTYFSDASGWCWDIRKTKVKHLLRQIRNELIELCGSGSYFHIGCDEALNFELTKENMDLICDFINEISEEIRSKNRRVILWGDMFLYRHPHYNPNIRYACNAPSPQAEQYMLGRLSRELIIADWQYNVVEAPEETSAVFTKAGFDCLLCPWDKGVPQVRSLLATAEERALMGVLHTTWHTLSKGMPYIAFAAVGGFDGADKCDYRKIRGDAADILRKVMPCNGEYVKAGWGKFQVDGLW